MAGDIVGFEPPRSTGGGGGGSGTYQGSGIYSAVAFSAELFLGPLGYSYGSGLAGYADACPVASTITKVMFRCAAVAVDLTVKLRTSGGTELYSGTIAAGDTTIDVSTSIAVAAGTRVQWSVTPASGTPSLDVCTFGWVRSLS